MINRLYICDNRTVTDPYKNLALEEILTFGVKEDECILYLWQNRRTVVIGRNQNCFSQCHASRLEQDGGHVARRLSGGGAVYHDMGNLNFTFCLSAQNIDVDKQLEVILKAVAMAGIKAERTGRNDIAVDGRKFSGNAFFRSGSAYYHHGTIMLEVDAQEMEKYLNVPPSKLKAKGVDSVRSRVVNLRQLNPGLTADMMRQYLIKAASEVYGLAAEGLPTDRVDDGALIRAAALMAEPRWIYGKTIPQGYHAGMRWPWGGVDLELKITDGRVSSAGFYTDALEAAWFEDIGQCLVGCPSSGQAMAERLQSALCQRGALQDVRRDICLWLSGLGDMQHETGGENGISI